MKIFKSIASISAVLIIVLVLCAKGLFYGTYNGPDVRINIPSDATDISEIFCKALGEDFGAKVFRMWKLQGGKPTSSHGSYLVKSGENSIHVSRVIAKGRQTPVKFTFNNIRTINELAAKAAYIFELDSATFIHFADSILSAEGFPKDMESAAFLPDTYEFYWTVAPDKLVRKLLEIRNDFWNDERILKAKKLGISPNEVHILASIVEAESNKIDERGKIARLYMNRLKRGMPLQADPTVKFAMKRFDIRRITGADLKYNSPFNTYANKGLPPGPIGIAEKHTLDQVLDAPQNDYIYMCAKSDFSGYHDFATTYDAHRINAAKYHRALNNRGIKN